MAAAGILPLVLPGADPRALGVLVRVESATGTPPRWQRRLAALGWRSSWGEAMRLSRSDARNLATVAGILAADEAPAAAAYRHGADAARDAALVRAAQAGAAPPATLEADLARGAAAVFPLAAADLGLEGPALGRALERLQTAWLASDFTLEADALLALLPAANG